MVIDKIDVSLLNLLQSNTKLNTKELAQKVGLSILQPTKESNDWKKKDTLNNMLRFWIEN